MAEPTTAIIAAWAAILSGVTMAVFGVDYYSLLYGMVGAMLALHQAETMPRLRAVLFVLLSTLVGSALGNAALNFFGASNKGMLFVGCIVGGAGAQIFINGLLKAALARIGANADEANK